MSQCGVRTTCTRFELSDGHDLEEIVQEGKVEIRVRDRLGKIVFQNISGEWLLSPDIKTAIADTMRSLSVLMMTGVDLNNDLRLRNYFALSPQSREFLLANSEDQPVPTLIDLIQHDDASQWSVGDISGNVVVKRDSIMSAMHVHVDQRFCEALAEGILKWPSIFTGADVEVRLLFASFDFGIIIAEDLGIRYYVGLGLADVKAFCVFIPVAGLCFGWNSSWHSQCFARMASHPTWVPNTIGRLLLLSSSEVIPWLYNKVITNGQVMWPAKDTHLGHYIWNELTGLEKIVAGAEPGKIDIWQMSNKDLTNFYGPLPRIFPEFAGRVRKDAGDFCELNRILMRSRTQAVRVSSIRVSETVRRRIQASIRQSADSECIQEMSDRLFSDRTVLLLGLREGKRVLINTISFYEDLVLQLQRRVGNLAVLIDGLNAAPGDDNQPFRIHDGSSGKSSLDAERHIAGQISSLCERIGVPCLSLIGTTMDFNLSMIMRAKAFVAPWGGGLAKYRWVANLPGYVLASAHNLSQPYILSIYHADIFMENGAPLVYADAADIEDVETSSAAGQSNVDYSVTSRVVDHAVETISAMLQNA